MPVSQTRNETKTADELLFNHYLRTGQRLNGAAAQAFLETKARDERRAQHEKSAESVLFSHYLRTGIMLAGEAAEPFLEQKFNPNHDPDDGRFTFGPGGGSLAPRIAVARIGNMTVSRQTANVPIANAASRPAQRAEPRPTDSSDPIGDIVSRSEQRNQNSANGTSHDDPIGEIIRQHEAVLRRRESLPTARPSRPSAGDVPRRSTTLTHWPIAGASVASLNKADKRGEGKPEYGPRGGGRTHRGIDIKAPEGSPVLSTANGQVVHVSPNPSRTFGYQVLIFHGRAIYTQYAHLKPGSFAVRPGQRVLAGQQIARVGRTDNVPSRGDAHLHFEVRLGSCAPAVAGGRTGNPLDYLPK